MTGTQLNGPWQRRTDGVWHRFSDGSVYDPGPVGGPFVQKTHIMLSSYRVTDPNNAASRRATRLATDAGCAAAVGWTGGKLFDGSHVYDSGFVNNFSASSAFTDIADGWPWSIPSVIGLSYTQWKSASTGTYDTAFNSYLDSLIALDHQAFLLAAHEPENDKVSSGGQDSAWEAQYAPDWCAMQAHFAKIVADRDDDRIHWAFCHMGAAAGPPAGTNRQAWNPYPLMPDYVKERTICAPDAYTKISATKSGGYTDVPGYEGQWYMQSVSSPAKFEAAWNDYDPGTNIFRKGISEHAYNNDAGAPNAVVAACVDHDLRPYLRSLTDFAYYAVYDSTGPAAGVNAYIDTPEEYGAFGRLALEFNKGIVL